jgi:cytidylate kinase
MVIIMNYKSIALDGPSGAGKSTLAKRVAKHFGFIYVDTGALYRAIGLFVFRNGINPKDEKGVLGLLSQIRLDMKYDSSGLQRILLNDEDVSDDIRLPEISTYASDVSAMPAVREFLLNMQRDMSKSHNVIMDGRDIGTVVLPGADLKIFITADDRARALRRFKELQAKGIDVTLEDVARDMAQRDKNDSERETAPLKAADDAITVDTTELDFEQSFQALVNLISEKLGL